MRWEEREEGKRWKQETIGKTLNYYHYGVGEAHGTCINDDRMKQGISNGHPIHGQQHHTNGYSIERDCRTPPNGYNHSSSGPVGRGLSEREADLAEQLRGRTLSEMDRSLLSGTEFDVFLSYAPEDFEFADEMRLRLNHRSALHYVINRFLSLQLI